MIGKVVLGSSLAIGAASIATVLDEGTRRSLVFWSKIGPIYLHYRSIQFLERDLGLVDRTWAERKYVTLHEKYSPLVREVTFTMRGFYLKQAQLMSTQDDFVPHAYMSWVKETQDNVPSEFTGSGARDYVALKLKEELDQDFDQVFSSWDDKPLGVASIGQVHKAILRSTGEEVAVKLLVPGIENRFRADIKTLRTFCKLAMPQHVSGFDEIERQFCTEFDYRAEAQNLETIRKNVLPKWSRVVDIPKPHLHFCSKHILGIYIFSLSVSLSLCVCVCMCVSFSICVSLSLSLHIAHLSISRPCLINFAQ